MFQLPFQPLLKLHSFIPIAAAGFNKHEPGNQLAQWKQPDKVPFHQPSQSSIVFRLFLGPLILAQQVDVNYGSKQAWSHYKKEGQEGKKIILRPNKDMTFKKVTTH